MSDYIDRQAYIAEPDYPEPEFLTISEPVGSMGFPRPRLPPGKLLRIRELPLTLLTITLIILKATGQIELSWVWVLCPVWIPAVIAIACLAFVGIFKSKEMAKNRKDR